MVESFEYSTGGDSKTGHGNWVTPDFQIDLSSDNTELRTNRSFVYDENAGKILPDIKIFDDENIRFGIEKRDMPTMEKLAATAIQEGILNDDLEMLQRTVKAFSGDRETLQAAVKEVDDVMVLYGREVRLGLTEEGGLVVFRTTGNTAMIIDENGEANVRDLRTVNRDGNLAIGDEPNGDADNFLDNMSMFAKLVPGQYYAPSPQFTSPYDSYYRPGYRRGYGDFSRSFYQGTNGFERYDDYYGNNRYNRRDELKFGEEATKEPVERTWRNQYGAEAPDAKQDESVRGRYGAGVPWLRF